METQPLVSIIIPTYNRADLIGETLDSIIAQTYLNWECIVVDDGSTDHTSEILQEYTQKDNRISYHYRPKKYKPGGNGARNYGFDISKGEYINWFDSDDVMLSDFISSKLLNIGDNYMLISSHFITDNLLEIIEKKEVYLENSLLEDYILCENKNFNIVTNNVLFRKEYVKNKKIRFNESILRGQETEFFLKLWSDNPTNNNLKILNKQLFYYRQHQKTKTGDSVKRLVKFNYSLSYVFFLKYNLSIKYDFKRITQHVIPILKNLTIKVIKDRDYKSVEFIAKNLFLQGTLRGIMLSIYIYILYFFNKTPKIIIDKWDKL